MVNYLPSPKINVQPGDRKYLELSLTHLCIPIDLVQRLVEPTQQTLRGKYIGRH